MQHTNFHVCIFVYATLTYSHTMYLRSLLHVYTHAHTHSYTHTHTHSLTLTHTHTCTHSLTHSLTHTHTHTHSHTHTHAHTHTHTHSQIISAEISELQSRRAVTSAKMEEYRRKLFDLGHRVLRVCLSMYMCLQYMYGHV